MFKAEVKREKITVKRGSAVAVIRPVDNNGYPAWCVEYYDHTKRLRRIKRAKLEEAKDAAEQVLDGISQGDIYRPLKREEVISYLTAISELPEGKMIHEVVSEWKKISAAKAVPKCEQKSFDSAWREMVESKQVDGYSPYYVQDLKTRLKAFGRHYAGTLDGLTGEIIDSWLRGLKVKPSTRNNFRNVLSAFVTFAKQRKYLPKEWDEMASVSTAKEVALHPVHIFTAEQTRKLIEGASDKILPFLALGFYAGIRHAEIERLDWSAINFKTKWITLNAAVVKSHRAATRRLVPLLPVLESLLEPIRKESGAFTIPSCYNIYQLCRMTGLKWAHNVPRHSFISHRVADTQNVNQVALECGNSAEKIFKHYRELVTPEQAKKYFEVFD